MSQFAHDDEAQNPYGAPQNPRKLVPPPGPPPATATLFGILNIIFGGLGVVGLGMTIVMWIIPANAQFPNPALDLMRDNATYRIFAIVSMVLGSIASIALIVGGVGLLRLRSWGRTLSIAYACYGIISVVIGGVVNYFLLFDPLMEQARRLPAGAARAGAIGGAIGGVFGTCFGLIYPVALLYFMLRPNLAAALRHRSA